MKANDRTTLYVDFIHLSLFHEELGSAVQVSYGSVIEGDLIGLCLGEYRRGFNTWFFQDEFYRVEPFLCEGLKLVIAQLYPEYLYVDVVEKKDNVFWVAFYNVPGIQKLRDLTSNKIGKLMCVAGTVTRTSEVRCFFMFLF